MVLLILYIKTSLMTIWQKTHSRCLTYPEKSYYGNETLTDWSSVFQVWWTRLTLVNNFLHLLMQPIFDKIALVPLHLQYNKGKWFLQMSVCMTLIYCLLLPTAVVPEHSPQIDDTKHWCFNVSLCKSTSISRYCILFFGTKNVIMTWQLTQEICISFCDWWSLIESYNRHS
jgi:hypothetical protein